MGGFINSVSNVLTRFIGRFSGFQSGSFELSRGNHKFTVDTEINPEKVWISTDEAVADGCGNIPVNKIGCTYLPNRLIFECDIETDNCIIYWFALE